MIRLILLLLCLAAPAMAHEPSMASLELREVRPGTYVSRWLLVPSKADDSLRPSFPPHCTWDPPELVCGAQGLQGRIGFAGLGSQQSAVLVRIQAMTGDAQTYTLTPVQPTATVRTRPREGWRDFADLVASSTTLGLEHILLGPDHLLFVLGLMWIVGWRWMLVKTITAFTVAHSLTLAAATFGVATPPTAAVNAAVALSILFLGPEMLRAWRGQTSLTLRRPYVVAFAFGLLHGFGFATALTDIGLPRTELPWALLGFNLGVEVGQLLFIALMALLARAVRNLAIRTPHWTGAVPAYTVGSLGAFWTLGRTAVLLGVTL
ncbi:MAG: HupE/UreJ family protein [Gemmatimonadaceae bacterium]|nr:HupE/UreJ family protein [Acetobacteraceae bacterium]